MGSPTNIFRLFKRTDETSNSRPYLLLSLRRGEFSNSDEDSLRKAEQHFERRLETHLSRQGINTHELQLVGECQGFAIGDVLYEGPDKQDVGLWYAETKFGHPWIVLGTAGSEEGFWNEVDSDEELSGLEPLRPAHYVEVVYERCNET